jgi:hypothetical protein
MSIASSITAAAGTSATSSSRVPIRSTLRSTGDIRSSAHPTE